jgi:hypothetical protein
MAFCLVDRLGVLVRIQPRYMSNEGEPYYTRERFKKDPRAQKLMRQFMNSNGEGGGAGRSEEFRAGYAYAFELDDAQRRAVDELRATKPDMSLKDAILEILKGTTDE